MINCLLKLIAASRGFACDSMGFFYFIGSNYRQLCTQL